MFKQHPSFNTPSDVTKIWRYMDFTKLVYLLDTQSLFFVRSDKFDDPFEGLIPKANEQWDLDNEYNQIVKRSKTHRKFTAITCWHRNDYESAAMWDLYLKNGDGVAIQSTIMNFKNSLNKTDKEIYLGKVDYIDYDKDLISNDIYAPYTHKRISFDHEKEVRAVYAVPYSDNIEPLFEFGVPIECDVEILIEKIHISPTAPDWFEELVRSVCKKYGLDKKITKSKLYTVK
ncbi:TPA: DUF2971 domain-containing protein [Bacillus cereus]|uniref:DUF2971 domain-containing protein n=1 Tax=Bacillus cereus TaxID=1396 RepID=UPI000BF38403|nr:DUF2971 domain-containing protein [Bacillus cereus]PFL47410.1 hypothetical protein COJ34_20450 [Bacillus cereus]PFQ99262.1 hypothetical protein COK32_05190 [Bacillus cereus]PGY81743.1 hypothetical protein COE36_25095 [Bacillus cereus]